MGWIFTASRIFSFKWWAAVAVVALYLVPLLKLATFPVSAGHPFFMFFNKRLGQFEHLVAWFRDTVVCAYLFAAGLWHVSFGINVADRLQIAFGAACLALVALSLANAHWKDGARRRLADFVRRFPDIHPGEFFAHLLCSAGGIRHALPERPYRTVDTSHLDFRAPKKHNVPLGNLIAGAWSTLWCAKLILAAKERRGREFQREVASALSVVWGTRMAELSRAEVIVEEGARLKDVHGFNVYLFNHMSFLDFAMAPLLLNRLPRFLIAKDHFLDNPLYHGVLGIGRVAEEMGMVFVERDEKRSTAKETVEEAAVKLVRDGIDFAIFPQGTRAAGKVSANGERMDAGYYAVGRPVRMKRDGDHLKKGAAHLATCAALILRTEGIGADVNVVPVAIKGTSVAAPRGSMRIRPNATIRLRVGEPIVVRPGEVEGIEDDSGRPYLDFVRRLHSRIDGALKGTVGVHVELERRFFEDMRKMAEPSDIEEMAIALKPWRGEDYLVHAILDCIYACRPNDWYPLLGRLMYLIRNDAPRDELLAFKGEVVDKMNE